MSEMGKRKVARAMSSGKVTGRVLCVSRDSLTLPHATAVFCNSKCLFLHHFQKIKKFEEKIAGNLYLPGNMCHVTLPQLDKLYN